MIHVCYKKSGDDPFLYLELWNVKLKESYPLPYATDRTYHLAEGKYEDGKFAWGKITHNFKGNKPVLTGEESDAVKAAGKVLQFPDRSK